MGNFEIPREKLKLEIRNACETGEYSHPDIELLFVLDGTLAVTVEKETTVMEREDLLVINAGKRHRLEASAGCLFARLTIQWQLVSDICGGLRVLFWCNSAKGDNGRYDELRAAMKRLLNHYLGTNGNIADFGHVARCYEVMDLLAVHFLVKSVDQGFSSEQKKYEDRKEQIDNYIRANYDQPLSLGDLAAKLYLSTSYLSRFFKKNYGMNFTDYLENVRLYYAMEELLYTDKPITRIVYDNGFSSVSAFNRAFREQNHENPSDLRRRLKKEQKTSKSEAPLPAADSTDKEKLEEFLRDDGIKKEESAPSFLEAEISVKKTCAPTSFAWKDMINIGSAADLLRSEVREHLALLQETYHFEYVRFWNIFSAGMLLNETGEKHNFSRLDSILEYLQRLGLKPHFELGRKPKRIHRTVGHFLVKDDEGSRALTNQEILETLKAMMSHLANRYSRREIAGWRFEIWFDEEKWNQAGSDTEYLAFFSQCNRIIKKISPKTQVGGCGLRINLDDKVLGDFLGKWQASDVLPDFLTGCFYGYEQQTDGRDELSKRSTDNEFLLHLMQRMQRVTAAEGFGDTPFYLNEWNFSISDRNILNDTCFKGAYIVKNMLDIYGMADVCAYFLGSDRAVEYYDSGSLLYGGNGLISRDGILKPAGVAMRFLNRLYPLFLCRGSHYLATTDGEDSYGILCHNQKALNYNYYFIPEDQVEREHVWKYFEERDRLTLNLTLTGLEDGMYKFKYYRVNEENGSVFDLWKEMGFEEDLSRNDIDYFRQVCEPKLIVGKQEAKGQKLSLSVTLAPNEIAFIRLRKLV